MTPDHYQQQHTDTLSAFKAQYGLDAYCLVCQFNVRKYLDRYPYKGSPIEDLEKARDYIKKMIAALEESKK